MKFNELEKKNRNDLITLLKDLKQELFNLRMQAFQGKLDKPSRVRECRRDFARVKTKLTQMKSA